MSLIITKKKAKLRGVSEISPFPVLAFNQTIIYLHPWCESERVCSDQNKPDKQKRRKRGG